MRTYCLVCKRHLFNRSPKYVVMTNKVIRNKSKHPTCTSNKSLFMGRNDFKDEYERINHKKVVIEYHKTNMLSYCLVCGKNMENKDAKMIKN